MMLLQWSADGRWLYGYFIPGQPRQISRISVDDGTVQPEWTLPAEFKNIFNGQEWLSTDGRRLVTAVVEEKSSDIWLVEDFDPDVE